MAADLMVDMQSVVIGQFTVTCKTINADRWMVLYGAEIKWYDGAKAAEGALQFYTECVRHQWSCAGFLDDAE